MALMNNNKREKMLILSLEKIAILLFGKKFKLEKKYLLAFKFEFSQKNLEISFRYAFDRTIVLQL